MKLVNRIKQHKLMTLVALTYIVLLIVAPDKALEAFSNSRYYFVEMLQIMPVIFLLTVAIDVLIPKSWIMKNMGDDAGLKGGVLALILGSVSAGPIYAAFPVTKMLLKKGASVGNVVIILSAWAVVKVPMLANEAKFLGPKFMGTRWVLTVIAIFIMGWIMNKIIQKNNMVAMDEEEGKILLDVNRDYCSGCGLCTRKVPKVFGMLENKARVLTIEPLSKEDQSLVEEVAEKCPSKAINYNPITETMHEREVLL